MYRNIIFIFLSFFSSLFFAQTKLIPPDSVNFRSPVGIPLYLAGNFGELRPNHFHSGLDIKTNGRQGYRIYAIEDGYVSRIKVSPWGYGKVLYITHHNGYTSVYAHLKTFKGAIAEYVKKAQLKNESWEIELFPPDSVLPVKKGDIIALSGNTGGSTAPHLHFEIRETNSEFPVNPMLFHFDIKDNIAPELKKIAFYPLNDTSAIYGNNNKVQYGLKKYGSNYGISGNLIIEAYGKIGIGIEVVDKMNETHNKYAVYEMVLLNEKDTVYYHKMNRFSFDNTRYVNALMDYEWYKLKKGKIQRSFLLPNNELSIYKYVKNRGEISISDKKTYHFTYIAKDVYGNTSVAKFIIKGKKYFRENTKLQPETDTIFSWNKRNLFTTNEVIADFPAKTFYENINFNFSVIDTINGAVSPTYHLHSDLTPVHLPYILSIKNNALTPKLRNKAVIIHRDFKGRIRSKGGEWRRNYISTKVKTLGDFAIMIDTIPPKITPVTIAPGKNMYKNSGIMVKISDDLSGIKSFQGEIDNQWIVMEYEYKNATLTHYFDKLPKGKHRFNLIVTDGVGNTSKYQCDFYY